MTPSTETRNASSERNRNRPQSQWQLGSIHRADRYHDPRKNNADNGGSVRVGISHTAPSNSWWQTTAGRHALSRPSVTEGGGRRPALIGLAVRPYSATEFDGWPTPNPAAPQSQKMLKIRA